MAIRTDGSNFEGRVIDDFKHQIESGNRNICETFKHSNIMITPSGFRDTFRKIQGTHEEGMRKVVIINGKCH